jgi:hypothetical protein
MSSVVTDQLKTNLEKELQELGIAHLPFEVIKVGHYADVYFKLALTNCVLGNAKMSDVLSEGESRAVAVASFLAELRTFGRTSALVFDDPVCSLDHLWRERVAHRLVMESKDRQLIIFTHDLVFLHDLLRFAHDESIPQESCSVFRDGPRVGLIERNLPWAAGVRKQIGVLKQMSQELAALDRDQKTAEFAKGVGTFYSRLRSAWERAVEESLLQGVVERFRRNIAPQKLRSVEVNDDDWKTFDCEYSKCCTRTEAHDTALSIGTTQLTPQDLEQDVTALDDFVDKCNDRKNEVEGRRPRFEH